jgi:transcriptional regulator with XRE-family HTH domain
MWELGKSMPDAATICKLAAFFGCSSDYLLGISDFKTENEKVEYIDTERVFYKNLENLRGRDKIKLINSLNRYITVFLLVEGEICTGFEHISSFVTAFAGILEEVYAARGRRDATERDGESAAKDENCEHNANGIINMGRQKLIAYDALEGMSRQALEVYLNVIKGVCCSHSDEDEDGE